MTVRRAFLQPRRRVRMTALGVAVMLLGTAQSAAATEPGGWLGLGWDLPQLQRTDSVDGVDSGLRPIDDAPPAAAAPETVVWPGAATAEADLPSSAAGSAAPAPKPVTGEPVAISRGAAPAAKQASGTAQHAPGKVTITTLDRAATEKTGIQGVLMQVAPVSGDTSGPIRLDLDYHGFGSAFGADYGGRLHLVQYPACILSTPDQADCRIGTPIESDNNSKTQHVAADLVLPVTSAQAARTDLAQRALTASAVVAAEAATKGGGGNFSATDLKPAGSWTSGGSGADFSYSYPIATPVGVGGSKPAISLNYSSSAVDGLTSATNNQASGIGDGWSLAGGGFIERSYKGCSQDLGGNNNQTKTGDLCWFNDNATISFAGANGELILDKDTNTWHLKDDDGTKVEKITGGENADKFGEYWKVTTPNGVQYFFGRNHLPGWSAGKAETQSTWTVPVFGNNTGEPCNATTFAASWCQRAWRWNLDYVVDPNRNATAYYYQPETNFYGLNRSASTANNPGTVYTRGGYLQKIEYGFNTKVADVFSHAPAQVVFDTAERCIPSGTITCAPAQLTAATATSWPDVPFEQICLEGKPCVNGGPSFFSRTRYTKIRTQVTDGGSGWKPVNDFALAQSFPATGDGNKPALWLDTITQTGRIVSASTTGTAITLPPTKFHGIAKANRVNTGSQYTALTRNRIDSITNPQGGVTTITYAGPECVTGTKMPASPESNSLSCFPAYWTPGGATDPVLDWFNKFRVTDVIDDSRVTPGQPKLTHYDYLGGAAWHHDDNPLTDPKYRTWSEWRGYGDIKTTTGQPAGDNSGPRVVTESFFLRGMEGAAVTSANWHETVTDRKELVGFARETVAYLDGKPIGGALNDPWVSDPTGTDADGRKSAYSGTETARTRTWLNTSSAWRISRTHTTFGKYGLAATVQSEPDTTDPTQTSCTITHYLENTDAWLLTYSSQVQKVSGPCDDKTNPPGPGNINSDSRSYYDEQAYGVAPTAGNVTKLDALDTWPAGGAETFTTPATTTSFDEYGRSTASTNVFGLTTTTAYSPKTGGPVTQVTTTTPKISDTNPVTLYSAKFLDPVSGAVVAETNSSGLRTDATFDALGRLLSVWKPGHSKALAGPADVTYAYTVSASGPLSNIVTKTLLSNGQYASSYSLVDGLGRTVQTQSPTPDDRGGRVVSDTIYDSQGRPWKTHAPYWNSGAPSATLLVVQDNVVPNMTVSTFDSAGRAIMSDYRLNDTEQWHTTTIPDGDRTTTIPPPGGTATTTITNGLGQTTQLLQYKDPTKTTLGSPADTTTYTYTRSGKQATTTDATGKNVWSSGYDTKDRKISSTDPDTGTTTFGYDKAGRLVSTTDARKRTISYGYDNIDRKTAEYEGDTSGTKLAEWTYDTLLPGLLTKSTRYVNDKAYSKEVTGYDGAGRPTGSKVTIPEGETGLSGTYQFGLTYDPNSGLVRTTTSPGAGRLSTEQTSYGYTTLGSSTTMMTADSDGVGTQLVSSTTYNPFGQVLRTNFQDPNSPYQVSVTGTYENGTNRLATTQAQRSTSANYSIANRVYTYNPVGDVTKIADTPQDATSDIQCFSRDYLRRLTEAWTPASGSCTSMPTTAGLGGAARYWNSWTFDVTGNRTTQVQHSSAGDITTTSTYPAAGDPRPHAIQASTTSGPAGTSDAVYDYNDSGSTASRGPAGAAQTFTYDAEGHVETATEPNGVSSRYLYDADGALLITREPTGTTLTVGDMELVVVTGATTALGTRYYTYNGQVIAQRKGDISLTWKLTDHQGTTYATVDAGNLAVTKRWQDPYGLNRGTQASTWPDKHGFIGGYQTTTGLTHLGARDYDPATGRFLTVDPILDSADPQSMNGYAYADNNPITLSDPSGLAPEDAPGYCVGWRGDCGIDPAVGNNVYGDYSPEKLARKGVLRGQPASKRHGLIKKYSPNTFDYQQLQNFWSVMGSAYSDRNFWDMATGNGDEHYCLGARGCQEAWIYLQANPDDIQGAKTIAATYCADHLAQCAHEDQFNRIVKQNIEDILIAAALVVGGGRGVAAEESASSGIARNAKEDAARIGCNSFIGTTQVLMVDGSSKFIAEVKVGDEVKNAEPDSDITQRHTVTAIHVTDDDHDFVDIAVATSAGSMTITTTTHHRFWDATIHAWIDATDLRIGDQLDTPGNGHAAVQALRRYATNTRTYNLTIDKVHTYYVLAGNTPVLVHNEGGGYSIEDIDTVANHLSGEFQSPANDEMIGRIRGAISRGAPLTGGQENFMSHELTEARLMAGGMGYEEAHQEALGTHPAGKNYDVDIIDKDESFGAWWRKQNGLPPRC